MTFSRKTGYKWLDRWKTEGLEALQGQSRRPRASPGKTPAALEAKVLEVRGRHPAWGARKIAHVLQRDQGVVLACSTVNSILKRNGCISESASQAAQPWKRFEREEPNELWQMDFKGHFGTDQGRCHPLTVLDDHSRFNLVLQAMGSEKFELVQPCLERAFQHYGLPRQINADNGSPWSAGGKPTATRLGLWLIRLGIRLTHSRPAHPQTNGKEERFHRTLKAEVLGTRRFEDFTQVQQQFNAWRREYNFDRPHQALGMQTPSQRYRPSQRSMPKVLPPIEYAPDDHVRRVQAGGIVHFQGREIHVWEALHGHPVALRPRTDEDSVIDLFFCHQHLQTFNLSEA